MGEHGVDWVDDVAPDEELDLGRPRRRRWWIVVAILLVVAGTTTWLIAGRSPSHHTPPVTRAISRAVGLPSHEVPLTSVLVPTGAFGRSSLPGASEMYWTELENISSHALGPVGDMQVLFPGRLNASVASTEIIPAGGETSAPISVIRPGQRVRLLVSFSWFCPTPPVRRPLSGSVALRVQVGMAAFRDSGVYDLDGDAGDDAFTVNHADCGVAQ